MTRIELVTSSLPRKHSTPELHRQLIFQLSGRRDSNSRPSAWKADALPTELLPLIYSKKMWWGWMDSNQRYLPVTDLQSAAIATMRHPQCYFGADGGIRTPDPLITNQLLWPTELHRHILFWCNN